MKRPQDSETDESTEAREGLLSLARTALFFMDLLALQDVLNPRRLVTAEVESVVRAWIDANGSDLATLRAHLDVLIAKEPSEILEMSRGIDAMLQQLAERLPVLREHPSERDSLRHVS